MKDLINNLQNSVHFLARECYRNKFILIFQTILYNLTIYYKNSNNDVNSAPNYLKTYFLILKNSDLFAGIGIPDKDSNSMAEE
jgi:hypothetical protein